MYKIIIIVLICLLITGCADTVTFAEAARVEPVGFWYGIWHGLISVFAWIGSLIWDDVAVYAIYNNGAWYDLGFLLGVGSVVGVTYNNREG